MCNPRKSEELGSVSSIFHFHAASAGARSAFKSMGLIRTRRHRIEAGNGAHALAGSCEPGVEGVHFWGMASMMMVAEEGHRYRIPVGGTEW